MREMKDSGIAGIEEIPANWNVYKLKYISKSIYKGNGITKDDIVENGNMPCVRYGEIYSFYNYMFDQCKTRTNLNKVLMPKTFNQGDILFATTGELVEEIGKCIVYLGDQPCLAGGDITVVTHNHNPRFLGYALNSQYAQDQKSIGKSKLKVVHLQTNDIKNLRVILPPYNEQCKIANYLDQKCSEIDAITKDIQSQIDTLEQYKRSVITEAVTKGLDPDVEMKDSGIEWIGKIPKNWKTAKLKYAIGMLTDYTANGSFADLAKNVEYHDFEDHARLIRLTDLRENLNNPGVYVNNEAYNYLSKSKLFGGEVLVANVGAYAGLFCEMPVIDRPATLGPNMFLIRANSNITNHFLFYIGNSFIVCEQLSQKAFSAAQPKLNKTDVKTIHLIIPPKEEQQIITTFLDNKCSEVDILIKDKQQQLSTLSDYKKSLIYEYVTGKKEVPAE